MIEIACFSADLVEKLSLATFIDIIGEEIFLKLAKRGGKKDAGDLATFLDVFSYWQLYLWWWLCHAAYTAEGIGRRKKVAQSRGID